MIPVRNLLKRANVVDLTAIEVAKHTTPPSARYEFLDAPPGTVRNELIVRD